MIVPFPVLLRPGAEDFVKEASESSAAERTEITDADILLGLVGRPLPWWRHIGW